MKDRSLSKPAPNPISTTLALPDNKAAPAWRTRSRRSHWAGARWAWSRNRSPSLVWLTPAARPAHRHRQNPPATREPAPPGLRTETHSRLRPGSRGRAAALAGPEARGQAFGLGAEQGDVFRLGRMGGTGRQAVDPRGADTDQELAVEFAAAGLFAGPGKGLG